MTGANEQSAPTDAPDAPDAPDIPGPPAQLEPAALRALSHPLRLRILDLLSVRGTLTASKLGEIVGESSGSTSYHLRQLEKHGLVREVEGKGTARERWWERTPGGFTISMSDQESPAIRATAEAVNLEFMRLRSERTLGFISRAGDADDVVTETWLPSTTFVTAHLWATPEQMTDMLSAWNRFAAEHIEPLRGQEEEPGAVPVEIHFDAFPLIDRHGEPL
ncbi:winged helix-turn-helix domain-containing protein [Myceligenerans xiligouense]|uniref:ArsR family transcriptional regulator n=1 Tax=Myceligenerans xiligouense TaxID=253184 RepID=A0A3N4YKR6_9MICO|nr:helix-turn-helix domain-containing protein [Myceligenerans xiligouense]RPF20026.1 ArsR family transcriptional regulator [Myceligenerans xiligouense]